MRTFKSHLKGRKMENLNVIYEDNHVIVVIKPQNIPTQADESGDKDMLTIVKEYLKEKYNKPGEAFVGLVHRLDRPTGGVMVFAKTSKSATRLSEQIRNDEMSKKYVAVTLGVPKQPKMQLVNYLLKNAKTNSVSVVPELTTNAKKAILDYELKDVQGKYSLVDVDLHTGRSHQIRVQLKHIGCPIMGDIKYGGNEVKGCNLALWAYELKFVHPTTKQKLTFKVYPPAENPPWRLFNLDKFI